ncbi:hypothetical protein BpHYR1_044431 [Brachionus plicatilis]|uniref:Uncharacterized protein n=1 Tax=Brachionus plicatilis TaxID=10195 RepID=A0A3M7PEH1_BRAPC|nr:hypothetical protein BpHYR1_044431 [Brachionus plicatilis]
MPLYESDEDNFGNKITNNKDIEIEDTMRWNTFEPTRDKKSQKEKTYKLSLKVGKWYEMD